VVRAARAGRRLAARWALLAPRDSVCRRALLASRDSVCRRAYLARTVMGLETHVAARLQDEPDARRQRQPTRASNAASQRSRPTLARFRRWPLATGAVACSRTVSHELATRAHVDSCLAVSRSEWLQSGSGSGLCDALRSAEPACPDHGARMGRRSFRHQSNGRAPAGATSAGSCQLMLSRPAAVGRTLLIPLQQ
jgi:hypothetical protein